MAFYEGLVVICKVFPDRRDTFFIKLVESPSFLSQIFLNYRKYVQLRGLSLPLSPSFVHGLHDLMHEFVSVCVDEDFDSLSIHFDLGLDFLNGRFQLFDFAGSRV